MSGGIYFVFFLSWQEFYYHCVYKEDKCSKSIEKKISKEERAKKCGA